MQSETSVTMLNTSIIVPNRYQPRKIFDDVELENLASSIKTYGIINPILVRKKDDKYEIIAGERRFRAAQKLGLTEVPVIIKNVDEQQMAELALIENLQRQGLSPIEEAKSYEEIMRIGNQTQASLASKLGKSQSAIANKIRLLSLPQEIQDALINKRISERHARSLISIQDKEKQMELLNRIITEKLTVKETEQIINAKEITEEEIKQAISDIMKSLDIKEEKEDDNMNNGNFFPNFDNNNAANNNASLNMMNMQSMNQPPVAPEPEVVMPTVSQMTPAQEPTIQQTPSQIFDQFSPNVPSQPELNNNIGPMPGVMTQVEPAPMFNETPLFGGFEQSQPAPIPQPTAPVVDEPLFNPNISVPTMEQPYTLPEAPVAPMEPIPMAQEPINVGAPAFEVPVMSSPVATQDRLLQLQELLSANGYNYKSYSNETEHCIIIEFPKN